MGGTSSYKFISSTLITGQVLQCNFVPFAMFHTWRVGAQVQDQVRLSAVDQIPVDRKR